MASSSAFPRMRKVRLDVVGVLGQIARGPLALLLRRLQLQHVAQQNTSVGSDRPERQPAVVHALVNEGSGEAEHPPRLLRRKLCLVVQEKNFASARQTIENRRKRGERLGRQFGEFAVSVRLRQKDPAPIGRTAPGKQRGDVRDLFGIRIRDIELVVIPTISASEGTSSVISVNSQEIKPFCARRSRPVSAAESRYR